MMSWVVPSLALIYLFCSVALAKDASLVLLKRAASQVQYKSHIKEVKYPNVAIQERIKTGGGGWITGYYAFLRYSVSCVKIRLCLDVRACALVYSFISALAFALLCPALALALYRF